jgi:hemin uptake protein HemP
MMNAASPPVPPQAVAPALPEEQVPAGEQVLASETLFAGRKEVVIRHEEHDYRLRITRQNKLILTK